ncbi:DUF433 domain-containing protein [Gloeobacter violaceus]|uniref:Gll2161 protein n=1 Tax=Gloeobacter violaceus (strain ATCC 29082 / PCC 7421) TaxID=251221 RepID=Q7NIM2_GLOVI|nr:DUF433 domain-containing protein [Gloeobacter violaceus]BAC90102.1 gll2161 [Gloeobacter violaceus PCC 7421]
MTSEEMAYLLSALTPAQKAQAVQTLTLGLTSTGLGVEQTPEVMGGDACIGRTRIPVWLLESFRRQGVSDAELLTNYPSLTAADLVNAWAYAEAYPDQIERALREHEAA